MILIRQVRAHCEVTDAGGTEADIDDQQIQDEPDRHSGLIGLRWMKQTDESRAKQRQPEDDWQGATQGQPGTAIAEIAEQGILHSIEQSRGQQDGADQRQRHAEFARIQFRDMHVDRQCRHRQRNGQHRVGGQLRAR